MIVISCPPTQNRKAKIPAVGISIKSASKMYNKWAESLSGQIGRPLPTPSYQRPCCGVCKECSTASKTCMKQSIETVIHAMTNAVAPNHKPVNVAAVELFFAVQIQMDVPFLDVVEHCLFFSVYDAVDKHGPHLAQELLARYQIDGLVSDLQLDALGGYLLSPLYEEAIRPYEVFPHPVNSIDVGIMSCVGSEELSGALAAEHTHVVTP